MDNMRMMLFAALGFVMLSLWQAWQQDYGVRPEPPTLEQKVNTDSVPVATQANTDDIPVAVLSDDQPIIENTIEPEIEAGKRIVVETDVFKAVINTQGGDIRGTALKKYPVTSDRPDIPFVLFNDKESMFYASQGGFLSKQAAANHHSVFTSSSDNYVLADGQDSLDVVLTWSEGGIVVEKIITFHRGEYLIDVTYRVKNNSSENWSGRFYEQLNRKHSDEGRRMLPTFTGAAISSPEKRYEKMDFDDLTDEPISRDGADGWVAMIQHYFVSALIPKSGVSHHYYSKVLDNGRYVIGLYGPQQNIAPGEVKEATVKVFSGPKTQRVLEKIAPGLELTVDYGALWFIAKPIFWLMDKIHAVVGNWGLAIILVTIVIKGIFYPLSAMGYKSMARMRKVTPRMTAIRERYSKDKARMNQAMMELYKEEKINPLGGCFPILIQIPVFLALYWVLLESVEMRQAPFMLWIQDLSIKDPWFILPLVMGVSMYIQQKLNPPPPDPLQAKVMQFLPVVFTIFFAFFPAGLVLYWVTNNILSIAQQWTITKQIEAAD
ncbi:MAG: membrane protein insertase YidC [Gammaproteobacteria bacterium]